LTIALGGGLAVALGLLVALDHASTHERPPPMLLAAVLFSPSTIAVADAALLLALAVIAASSLTITSPATRSATSTGSGSSRWPTAPRTRPAVYAYEKSGKGKKADARKGPQFQR